jgi:hypothetical protein
MNEERDEKLMIVDWPSWRLLGSAGHSSFSLPRALLRA